MNIPPSHQFLRLRAESEVVYFSLPVSIFRSFLLDPQTIHLVSNCTCRFCTGTANSIGPNSHPSSIPLSNLLHGPMLTVAQEDTLSLQLLKTETWKWYLAPTYLTWFSQSKFCWFYQLNMSPTCCSANLVNYVCSTHHRLFHELWPQTPSPLDLVFSMYLLGDNHVQRYFIFCSIHVGFTIETEPQENQKNLHTLTQLLHVRARYSDSSLGFH